jgi:hypothetical protein
MHDSNGTLLKRPLNGRAVHVWSPSMDDEGPAFFRMTVGRNHHKRWLFKWRHKLVTTSWIANKFSLLQLIFIIALHCFSLRCTISHCILGLAKCKEKCKAMRNTPSHWRGASSNSVQSGVLLVKVGPMQQFWDPLSRSTSRSSTFIKERTN